MPLPTVKSRPEVSLSNYTTLIYGAPKRGKSTFASKFPNALFLDCEMGLKALEVYRQPITSWRDLLVAAGELAAGQHEFRTIVIDTADVAYQYCLDYVLAQLGIKHESELEFGKAYAAISLEWNRVLRKLASLPYGLVLISHAKQVEVKTRTGKVPKIVPTLPDRAAKVVLGMADLLLYVDIEAEETEGGVVVERSVVRTKPTTYYDAGDRTGLLPETLPLDWGAFRAAFNVAARDASDAVSQVDAQREADAEIEAEESAAA